MRVALVFAVSALVGGCGIPSSIIKSETISYDEVIEETTNKLLLANILRARDKAPLHFSDMTKVTETVSQQGTVGSALHLGASQTPTDTYSPGFTLQMAPNFELAHVYTKEFVTGLASPISPKFVKYWLDRGLDQRAIMFLFFASVDIVRVDTSACAKAKPGTCEPKAMEAISIHNAPREAIDSILNRDHVAKSCSEWTDFERYMTFANHLRQFYATETKLPNEPIARKLPAGPKHVRDTLKAISRTDPAKYKITCVKDTNCDELEIDAIASGSRIELNYYVQDPPPPSPHERTKSEIESKLPASTERATLDFTGMANEIAKLIGGPRIADAKGKDEPPPLRVSRRPDDSCRLLDSFFLQQAGKTDPKKEIFQLNLNIRSVGEIIQFLGDLLELQERLAGTRAAMNNPITLGYCRQSNDIGCADVLFTVDAEENDSRLKYKYRNKEYSIANFSAPGRRYKDHSIEVLAVLNQLIGLHRSSDDVKSTPSVRLIP